MLIELRGAHLENKGAALMLHAMVQALEERLPAARLAIAPSGMSPYAERARLGLYQKLWYQRYGRQWGYTLSRLMPATMKAAFGIVDDSEIDVVLDASGFAYSDQWGPEYAEQLLDAARRWAKRGTKLVLMPQAFGPFSQPRVADAMRRAVELATLVYARDRVSLDALRAILAPEHADRIRLAPDFTNLVRGVMRPEYERLAGGVCVVPNRRVIDKGGVAADAYITLVTTAFARLRDVGQRPFLLVHEGKGDLDLALRINAQLTSSTEIVDPGDALVIKGIIGQCSAFVGSRFHGLVSALAQGVPAIAIGWSHKYRELFSDYGVNDDTVFSELPSSRAFGDVVSRLGDDGWRRDRRAALLSASETLKQGSRRLWTEVVEGIAK
jgi:polysaccharide pyruvyl transferase WcaK-like protein